MKAGRTIGALFARLVEHVMARVRFFGVYEYVVQSQSGEFVELRPRDSSLGIPDQIRAPMRPGIPGGKGKPAVGSAVLVQFVDGDESRPYIAAFAGGADGGFVPIDVTIDASGTVYIAPSGKVELSSTAGGRILRVGEKIVITGLVAGSTPVTCTSGATVITLDPIAEAAPGPPGTGYSEAFA